MTEQQPTPQEEKQKNFVCTPNILFASYKHLTIEEKYLWQNLKRLYWDGKPRYMGLREWSEVTGYSTGALSKMLPRLHTCKLLDAVMERENGKGNAKYRITVLDITDLNKKYYSCSPNERVLLDPSLELVHENTQACSPNERTRSPKRTSLFTKRDKPVHENGQENPVDPPVESDDGTPKDLLKDPSNISLQINEEEGEPNVEETSSPPKDTSSHIDSSSVVSDFPSGDDTPIESSGSLSTADSRGNTPDPESSTNVNPEIFAQSGQVLDKRCTSLDKTPTNAPSSVASGSIDESLIVIPHHNASSTCIDSTATSTSGNTPNTTLPTSADPVVGVEESTPVVGGYTKDKNHLELNIADAGQGDSIPTGNSIQAGSNVDEGKGDTNHPDESPEPDTRETPDNVAVLEIPPQSVSKNNTAITQAELIPTVGTGANPDVMTPTIDEKGPAGVVTGKETGRGKRTPKTAQQTLIDAPLVEPCMIGPWDNEKVVQYAEFHNGKRYPVGQRTVQIAAARTLHKDDASLTLEQFRLAYDECNDDWWKEHVAELHVKHMQRKVPSSGEVRIYAMLHKAEAKKKKKIIPFQPKAQKREDSTIVITNLYELAEIAIAEGRVIS